MMTGPTKVLITGVADYWGARLAAHLLRGPDIQVIGLDTVAPKEPISGLDLIQADPRNPLLVELLRSEQIDAICHLAIIDTDRRSEAAFDHNVMGTMKVFGAAAEAGVKKIVFKSSTMVYGARADNSAFLLEEQPLTTNKVGGTLSDLLEIEAFCNGFRGQNPEIGLTVLRFPGIVGPTVDTRLTRYLSLVAPPFLMGFDPRMQVIHEDDVVEALAFALLNDVPGTFNIAAEGILPLSQVLGLAGRVGIPIFHLAAYWANPLLGGVGFPINHFWPVNLDYMRYAWVGDLTRMRNVMGYVPRYSAAEALREFAGRKRLQGYNVAPEPLVREQERLKDTLERRRRQREREPIGSMVEPSAPAISTEEEEEAL